MHYFAYRGRDLYCEEVKIETLARRYGTPLYVYSYRTLAEHFTRLSNAFASLNPLICYAVKANSNAALLAALHQLGSGFDIVSGGELRRVLAAGGDPGKCVFAGVGKSEAEMEFALQQKIYSFNVESEAELDRLQRVAKRLKTRAPIAFRVNPNVDAGTHAKITTGTYENKFGVPVERVERLYAKAAAQKNIRIAGVQMHIGSQLLEVAPFQKAVERILPVVKKLGGQYPLEFFSVGGGLGIVYESALASGQPGWWLSPPGSKMLTPELYAQTLTPALRSAGLRILFEPGRFIVGNAGILLTRVEYIKKTGRKNFVIVDAAMNDLIRPSFYDSYHEIVPLRRAGSKRISSDVVGPVCESSDFFCKDRPLPPVEEGDYLALLSAGAYGSVMASNYNTRPLTAEVLVKKRATALIRARQETESIWELEQVPPWLRRPRQPLQSLNRTR